ncbi:conserved Plasmodium protein, unknown function [Plasmodium gallinaceum]|uniref:tRNA-intron lyase n=1 Tax=Plasmodium gallinaceum TaxID=5849 RepID=A0A1J1H0P9_PLAGA|nr:conserved Plasmodium protein, unknown function [Plasmodium gallinaceum]CRG97106.1 conserved Plasmodium protein, unknown function [Plasmodium gallinaceum]
MRIIYKYKNEYYELLMSEENADDKVIEVFKKNTNKFDYNKIKYYEEINSDLLNFEQFSCSNIKDNKKKKGKIVKLNYKLDNALNDKNKMKLYLKYKRYFENKNYIVKSGHIYGADLLLYLSDEKYTHSIYVVYFINEQKSLRDLIQILRLSCTIKKKVILVIVNEINNFDIYNSIVYIKVYLYK